MLNKLNTEPKIYVACLAAYNNGQLHGRWISMLQSLEAIQAEIAEMLAKSPIASPKETMRALINGEAPPQAEEYAVHDHEGFGGYTVGEYPSIEKLQALCAVAEEFGEVAFGLANHLGTDDADSVRSYLEDSYQGEHKDLSDWAYQLAEDTGDLNTIPEHFRNYIDWEAIGRDSELNGDVFTIDGDSGVHVFWNH